VMTPWDLQHSQTWIGLDSPDQVVQWFRRKCVERQDSSCVLDIEAVEQFPY
jgi:hypothetical protein